MSRNRQRQRKRATVRNGCAGKVRYRDMNSATVAAQRLIGARKVRALYVYLCPHGAHYHVSRKRGKDWQRRVAMEET